jgi:hypothetical protein
MNRGDARLFFAIVATAIVAAATTGVVMRLIGSATTEAAVVRLEHRVEALEKPVPALPPPTVIPMLDIPLSGAETMPVPEPVADPDPCDEVSCVLNNYEPTCCAHFKKPSEGIDRAMIVAAMATVKPLVQRCGDHSSAKGRVKVSVKVAPDGTIGKVTVVTTPDVALGTCVAAAFQGMKFPPTISGGSFGYPFQF